MRVLLGCRTMIENQKNEHDGEYQPLTRTTAVGVNDVSWALQTTQF